MNGLINAGYFFVVTSFMVVLSVSLFNLLTRHKLWEEIAAGNLAMGMSTGGIILGVANVMRIAILVNHQILPTILWGGVGTLALIAIYFAFEYLTPKLNVKEELDNDNRAVGFVSMMYSVAFSFIIGACIA